MTSPSQDRHRHEPGHAAELTPDEARSAVKPGVVRYVLAISLWGAILGMALAWLFFAR
jgi:hypothetical protein